MQLKLRRSQRTGGLVTDKVFFLLDARVELNGQESADVKKYRLGKTVIYNSEASKKHIEAGAVAGMGGSAGGLAKAAFRFAMARLNLNISIDDLCHGKHVECKDLDELMGAEEAIMTACENLRAYLDRAATFDGGQVLYEFKPGSEAVLVSAPGAVVPLPASGPPPVPMLTTPSQSFSEASQVPPLQIVSAQQFPVRMPSEAFASAVQFDEMIARAQEWWRGLTPALRVLIIGGTVVVVLFLITR